MEKSCYVCGRPVSELKPFGGTGEPKLVKINRRSAPYDETAEGAWKDARKEIEEIQKGQKAWNTKWNPSAEYFEGWFIGKYGRKKGHKFYLWDMLYRVVQPSLECRDCINLNGDDYWETIEKSGEKTYRTL